VERTIISMNLPNFVTIPAMVAVDFLVVVLAVQLWRRLTGGSGAAASTSGGY
jgi:hypothetical protein